MIVPLAACFVLAVANTGIRMIRDDGIGYMAGPATETGGRKAERRVGRPTRTDEAGWGRGSSTPWGCGGKVKSHRLAGFLVRLEHHQPAAQERRQPGGPASRPAHSAKRVSSCSARACCSVFVLLDQPVLES